MRKVPVDEITLLTRDEVAEALSISRWSVDSWVKQGKLPRPIQLTDSTFRWRLSDLKLAISRLAREVRAPRPLQGRAALLVQGRTRVRVRVSDGEGA